MGEYEPKIEVHFPDIVPAAKGSVVKLECFALGKYVEITILYFSRKITHTLFNYTSCINVSRYSKIRECFN